jgi:acyl-coenzyme A thioesterase PaaI-like protein
MHRSHCEGQLGIGSVDQLRQLSGLAFVAGLSDGTLPLNPMAKTLDYRVVRAEGGYVMISAQPKEDYFNPWGTVHGGFSATLLDSSMGLAIQSSLARGFGSTTLEFKISFIRPITSKPDSSCPRTESELRPKSRHRGRVC